MRAVALLVVVALASTAAAEGKQTAWFDAAREGNVAALKAAAGKRPAAVIDTVDASGYSALILAAYHDGDAAVAWLVARGANTCVADKRGYTALMGAVFRGHDRIVDRLAKLPCGADHVTASGQTPLMLAALFGRADAVTKLLAAGADPTRADANGFTARSLASGQSNDEIVALLDRALAKK